GTLAAVMAASRLVMGVDSGPLHLAAAVGAPTLRMYGPTDPLRFGPWGPPGQHVLVQAQLPCSPCGNLVAPPCGARREPPCMLSVRPEQVSAALAALLGEQIRC